MMMRWRSGDGRMEGWENEREREREREMRMKT